MDTLLLKDINNIVEDYVRGYIKDISEKYKLDQDALYKIWTQRNESKSIPKKPVEMPVKEPTKPEKNNSKGETKPRCRYRIQKGVNKGKFCSENASRGKMYCSRHKNFEGKEEKEIVSKPQTDPVYESNRKKLPEVKKNSRTLVLNKKFKKFYHESTKFLFDENKERKIYQVVGKLIDGAIVDLKEEDVEECKKWSFHYVVKENTTATLKDEEDLDYLGETEYEEEEDGDETECECEGTSKTSGCICDESKSDGEEEEEEDEEDEESEEEEEEEDIIDSESDYESSPSLQLKGIDRDLVEEGYSSEEF